MSKRVLRTIPENMSFAPDEVKKGIAEFETLASRGELSHDGYAELAILKIVEEMQEEERQEKETSTNACTA